MTPSRWALAALAGAAVVLAACSSIRARRSTPRRPARAAIVDARLDHDDAADHDHARTDVDRRDAPAPTSRPRSGQSQGAAGTITGAITVTNTGTRRAPPTAIRRSPSFRGVGAPHRHHGERAFGHLCRRRRTRRRRRSRWRHRPRRSSPTSSPTCRSGSETSCPTSEWRQVTMPGVDDGLAHLLAWPSLPAATARIRVSPVYAAPERHRRPLAAAVPGLWRHQDPPAHGGVEHAGPAPPSALPARSPR